MDFIHLNKCENASKLLNDYLEQLDKSFEPPLSSYVDIAVYSKKLIENAYVCVLTEDAELAGLFALYLNNQSDKIAYLSSIAVLDKFKGKGCAQMLLDKVIDLAHTGGMEKIKLEVKSDYLRAIKFYEKYGFERLQGNAGKDSFYMQKKIKS